LFNKSILTTQDFRKINGTIVDETPKPFYIGRINDLQNLKNATIIESLYNQNNLWQIFMEVGKYIHAKPYLTFGTDNRYLVNFNYYGRTDQNTDNTNRISVFNSKFVEEYISSCTSYITNMVQLGGTITEILAPKSTSSDYLVSNNTAELITNKNIIEIDDLQVIRKSDNEIRDLAGKGTHGESTNGYVFSKDIYNLLSVNANDSINKGLAIYYELGTNIVKGFNYQLPSINTGDAQTDYAIKRIIGTVFGIETSLWKDIKVNDYLFKIVYKTKDTLRQDQSRPDLRKFILATKYDRVPQHIQFNNQTDIVVDSARFGNNIYGKLIRTGNSIIQKGGWISDLNNLIRAGDLYYINDEPYYASKVKTTYFVDHAICDVEYSKDFNRLSQIIGIPSEPRFYEVATTNLSNREKNFNDYVLLGTTNENVSNAVDTYIQDNGWNYLNSLLFENGIDFPKYSVTYFKNDIDKATPVLGSGSFSTSVCLPISCYTSETTLTFEPACVIYLDLSFASVDVNVHPAKTEVKFTDEKKVFDTVHYAVRSALESESRTAEVKLSPGTAKVAEPKADFYRTMTAEAFRGNNYKPSPTVPEHPPASPVKEKGAAPVGAGLHPASPSPLHQPQAVYMTRPAPAAAIVPPRQAEAGFAPRFSPPRQEEEGSVPASPPVPDYRLIGEALDTYIIIQRGEDIMLIDKHACHERVIFDRLKAESREIMAQTLLAPVTLTPSAPDAEVIEANSALLSELGFEIEPYGESAYAVRTVPADIDAGDIPAAVEEICEKLRRNRSMTADETRDEPAPRPPQGVTPVPVILSAAKNLAPVPGRP
jgi:hypothetical protein